MRVMGRQYKPQRQPSWLRRVVAQALLDLGKVDRLAANRLCLEREFRPYGVADEWEAAKKVRESLLEASDEVLALLEGEAYGREQRELLIGVLQGLTVAEAARKRLGGMRRETASRGPWKKVTHKVARVFWRRLQDRRDGDRRDGDRRG